MMPTRLEQFLVEHRLGFMSIPIARHKALERQWNQIYGAVWSQGLRHKRYKHELKAQLEYSRRSADVFLVVPFLGNTAGPHGIGKREMQSPAFECTGSGPLPDMSPVCNIDLFVAPPDLSWTMLHTHEDHTLGGPYFIDRDWLVPATRKVPRF